MSVKEQLVTSRLRKFQWWQEQSQCNTDVKRYKKGVGCYMDLKNEKFDAVVIDENQHRNFRKTMRRS